MSDEATIDLKRLSLLPDFCRNRYVLPTLLIAELIAIILCLPHYESPILWLTRLGLYSLFAQWVAIISISLLCLARKPLSGLSNIGTAFLSYTLILLVTAVSALAFWHAADIPLRSRFFGDTLWDFGWRIMLTAAIAAGLVIHYLYVQHAWRRQVAMRAQERVQALQAKIRPHFLFNTMNTISATLHRDPQKADDMIVALCELLRAGLRDSSDSVLRDELQLCRHYLDLEKIRLGERLRVEWETDDLPDRARIPWLTLQPLLENAVYHGIEKRPEGGVVRVAGRRDADTLIIRLENPTGGVTPVPFHPGHGQALDNTRTRLRHYYDGRSDLTVTDEDGRFTVQLTIPYKAAPGR